MFDNLTIKELVALLLTMPQDAKIVTYHLGNWPDVISASCERMGNDDEYVELNLNYYEAKVTETKTTILTTINDVGPLGTLISIVPSTTARSIDLVIGSTYSSRCASHFDKEGLGELIKILQEVHDAMYDV